MYVLNIKKVTTLDPTTELLVERDRVPREVITQVIFKILRKKKVLFI